MIHLLLKIAISANVALCVELATLNIMIGKDYMLIQHSMCCGYEFKVKSKPYLCTMMLTVELLINIMTLL